MADSGNEEKDLSGGNSWFADILGDGSSFSDQLQAVKSFAYNSFDRIDLDGNGFVSHSELEQALANPELQAREGMFLSFLINNHDQIVDAFDESTISDGISRKDLESYFDLISTLL